MIPVTVDRRRIDEHVLAAEVVVGQHELVGRARPAAVAARDEPLDGGPLGGRQQRPDRRPAPPAARRATRPGRRRRRASARSPPPGRSPRSSRSAHRSRRPAGARRVGRWRRAATRSCSATPGTRRWARQPAASSSTTASATRSPTWRRTSCITATSRRTSPTSAVVGVVEAGRPHDPRRPVGGVDAPRDVVPAGALAGDDGVVTDERGAEGPGHVRRPEHGQERSAVPGWAGYD